MDEEEVRIVLGWRLFKSLGIGCVSLEVFMF